MGRLGGADVASLPRHPGVKIRFIGVYDTVGALGVPLAGATHVNEPIVGFHDTTLGDSVEHAVQALAVDERRGPYVPTLWTQAADAAALAGQSVLQVWFPGVHSDIGGGYGDKGIGNITWDFMMRQAAGAGARDRSEPADAAGQPGTLPAQHESFDKTWQELSDKLKLIPQGVRAIGPTMVGPGGQTLTVATRVCLHPSLVDRLGKRYVTILNEARTPPGGRLPTRQRQGRRAAHLLVMSSRTGKHHGSSRSTPWARTPTGSRSSTCPEREHAMPEERDRLVWKAAAANANLSPGHAVRQPPSSCRARRRGIR